METWLGWACKFVDQRHKTKMGLLADGHCLIYSNHVESVSHVTRFLVKNGETHSFGVFFSISIKNWVFWDVSKDLGNRDQIKININFLITKLRYFMLTKKEFESEMDIL